MKGPSGGGGGREGVSGSRQEGRQGVRSQVRGGDNDKLCFSAVSDGELEGWRERRDGGVEPVGER